MRVLPVRFYNKASMLNIGCNAGDKARAQLRSAAEPHPKQGTSERSGNGTREAFGVAAAALPFEAGSINRRYNASYAHR